MDGVTRQAEIFLFHYRYMRVLLCRVCVSSGMLLVEYEQS